MNNVCTECGMPMVLKPAGVSRTTGKPYNAFYACSSGQRHQQAKAIVAPQPQNATAKPSDAQNRELVLLEAIDAINKRLDNMATFLVEKLGTDKKEEVSVKDIPFG